MNPLLPFDWITALRFLREGRMQTLFIISGVSVGIAVIVFMSAMLAGLGIRTATVLGAGTADVDGTRSEVLVLERLVASVA